MFAIPATIALFVSASVAQPGLSTPNGTVNALYDVISGPVGEKRDVDAFRALFHETAKMVSVSGSVDGKVRYNVIEIEGYVKNLTNLERIGFTESEVKNTTEIYGNVAHVFTTYVGKYTANGEEHTSRGINSVQLMFDGEKWLIMNIVWQNEVPGIEIPKKYLPDGN